MDLGRDDEGWDIVCDAVQVEEAIGEEFRPLLALDSDPVFPAHVGIRSVRVRKSGFLDEEHEPAPHRQ